MPTLLWLTLFPCTQYTEFTLYACVHDVGMIIVVGNALSKNPKLGEVVARVNILAAEG